MKKLQLDVENLSVESFGTVPAEASRGTVAAYSGATCSPVGGETCVYHCTFQGPTCFNQC